MVVACVSAVLGLGVVCSYNASRSEEARATLERIGGLLLVAGFISFGAIVQAIR